VDDLMQSDPITDAFLAEERKAIEKFGFSEDMVDRLVDIQL
jgi:hypothetical protein